MPSKQGEGLAKAMDAAYEGVSGRTRTEMVQVWMPDGQIRALPVYVGVDAQQDPALAALARSGHLHDVEEGVSLAMPFVYHDPERRLFLLVVPEGLRHRALSARAELLAAIAGDSEYAVPEYVRDVEVVIGTAELNARLSGTQPSRASSPSDVHLDAARARALREKERELARRERLLAARELALRTAVDDSELEEIDDETTFQELDEDGQPAFERAVVEAELDAEDDDFEEAVAADDAVEEVEDVEISPADGTSARFEVDQVPAVLMDETDLADGFQMVATAPTEFASDEAMQLCLSARSGSAWLFIRGRPPVMHEGTDIEFLLQLDPDADVPVALLTLVFDSTGVQEVRHGVIDPWDPDQIEALRLLGEHFSVELVSWSDAGTLDHWATLQTPREANARAVLAVLEDHGEPDPEAFTQACQRLLAAPPPWRDVTHPFQLSEVPEPPLTATEAAVLVDELSHWLAPARRERLRLLLCVPDEVVDERTAQGLGYALDWGLALPGPLAARALELGIAKDEAGLLLRRIEGLTRTSNEPDFGGMEESVLHALWADTLEQAARIGVTLPDAAREAALQHGGELAQLHAEALAEPHDEELARLREQADGEAPAPAVLEELARRGGYRDLLRACRATERVSAEAAAKLFASVARRSDPIAVDGLLTLLNPAEPVRVRAGAALALSHRRAVNAIDELAKHVAQGGEAEWPLFALALGRYGGGSFRAIARALTDHEVPAERAERVLAHLALHGARSQVRAKTRVQDAQQATLAQRALALASELKDGRIPASGLEPQGTLTVFSELFDRSQREPYDGVGDVDRGPQVV